MQGSRIALIVAVAAAVMGASFGCTVNNYPEPRPAQPPSPAQQQRQPQAQAVQPANAPPTPTTRNVPATPPPGAAQQSAPAPQPSAGGKSYTIKPGDNLWNIAKEVYGDGTKYQRILDANPGLNPDNMKPGTKIVIP
jgi:5'-nucleotidase / UDP-sugar diphosphatase